MVPTLLAPSASHGSRGSQACGHISTVCLHLHLHTCPVSQIHPLHKDTQSPDLGQTPTPGGSPPERLNLIRLERPYLETRTILRLWTRMAGAGGTT